MGKRSKVNDTQKANNIVLIPRNKTQKSYLKALDKANQIIALGPAGTGKTYLASAWAAKMYLRGEIDKIIITRPRVEVDEEWGALPGGLHRKTQPWAFPIIEILEECLGKARLIDAQKRGDIEVLPLAFMRGRTLQKAFCILDEAQNTTVNQMKMFVTRIGEESKIIINGDIAQTDISSASGLGWALSMVKKYNYIPLSLIEFDYTQVERSKTCAAWIKAMHQEDACQVG